MAGKSWGAQAFAAYIDGMHSQLPNVKIAFREFARQQNLMDEARGYIQAVTSVRHADWYCALPWYRMWWAMVTGR